MPALIIGSLSYWAYSSMTPINVGGHINPIGAVAAGLLAICVIVGFADCFKLAGDLVDRHSALQTTGLKGTAGFAKSVKDLGDDYEPEELGPYWGALETSKDEFTEVISDIESVGMVCGTSGSGKSSGLAIPTILTIPHSKLIPDFKEGNLACQLAETLLKQGETVHVLNFANKNTDILGESACFNPSHIITDCLKSRGGLLEIIEILDEEALQIYPETTVSGGGASDNEFFHNGSRFCISFARLTTCLVDGEAATMGDASMMLMDRDSLLRHAQWGCGKLLTSDDPDNPEYSEMPLESAEWATNGLHDPEDVKNFIAHYRAMCRRMVKILTGMDARTADPFLEGAQQKMVSKFGIATRSHKITQRSTFRFSDQKEGDKPTTVFLVVDPNTLRAQGPLISHIFWCALQEWKRHSNKSQPTYLIGDECSNFIIPDLGSLLTFARAYCRMILFLQNFSSFREAYSEQVLLSLLSEAELQLYLPATREKQVLEHVASKLGDASVMTRNKRGDRQDGGLGIDGVDYREDGRPLMTPDELRRTDKGVLFIRRNMAALVSIIPFASIDVFQDIVGIDPFHGKKWILPIKMHFSRKLRGKCDA